MQKYYLVPPQLVDQMQRGGGKAETLTFPPTTRTPIQDMEPIPESDNDDALWRKYAENFTRFQQLSDAKQPLGFPSYPEDVEKHTEHDFMRLVQGSTESGIFQAVVAHTLDSLPPTLKQKGYDFLRLLSTVRPGMFTQTGELLDPQKGWPIVNSSFHDLIHFLLRKRKSLVEPIAWHTFRNMLYDTPSIPREYLKPNSISYKTKPNRTRLKPPRKSAIPRLSNWEPQLAQDDTIKEEKININSPLRSPKKMSLLPKRSPSKRQKIQAVRWAPY